MSRVKIYGRLCFIMLISLLSHGCNPESHHDDNISKGEMLYKEAIEIHDEIMPLMGKVHSLAKSLEHSKDSLSGRSPEEIQKTIRRLEDAGDSMMNWMRTLKTFPSEETSDGEHQHHHQMDSKTDTTVFVHKKQKQQIIQIKDEMTSAINKAVKLLEKELQQTS